MNRIGLSTVVVAALAGLANAQVMTITWGVSDTGDADGVLTPGESAILTMYAAMNPGAVGFAGSIYNIGGDADWGAGSIGSYTNLVDSLATGPGDMNAGNFITGIESFQLPPFFNPSFNASNPIAVYQIVWTPADYSAKIVSFGSFDHINFDVYTDNFGSSTGYTGEVFPGLMKIIPAPASAALLGLGGLVGARRRR